MIKKHMAKTVDLPAFKKLAARKKKIYTSFLRGVHNRKNRNQIDKMALELHTEAFAKIDCLDCGNCCKTMTPTYLPSDIKRIAKHMGMTPKAYTEKYTYVDDIGDVMNRSVPCHFLLPDNKCSIYEIRPVDCRGFPHTNKKSRPFVHSASVNKEFFWRCPAVFHIVDNIYNRVIECGNKLK